MTTPRTQNIAAIAAINDPQRRALLELVSRSPELVSRDSAATSLGIPRSTAAFHLERLVDEGLLEIEFKRLNEKTGPGSGRPSKLYKPAAGEISVSIPTRDYELAGELLAAAIEKSDRTGMPVRVALSTVARETGQSIGARAGSLDAALEACGYEPHDDDEGGMVLTNCPFDRLSASHTEVICNANVDLLTGVATGANDVEHSIEFEPSSTGDCCVRVRGKTPTKS